MTFEQQLDLYLRARCTLVVLITSEEDAITLTREEIDSERPGVAPRREFPFLVGQPEAVRRAYDEAMGFAT